MVAHQCRECRNWQDCPSNLEWYPPAVIKFCPKQMIWLLTNLTVLQDSLWPPEHKYTGYTEETVLLWYKHAYFETPAVMSAEVTYRIGLCGDDGRLACDRYAKGIDSGTLAYHKRWPVDRVERRVDGVIRYISGWRRKKRSYNEFINHRR